LCFRYGGSVGCNILYPCQKCQFEEENLKCRQREEKSNFVQVNQLIISKCKLNRVDFKVEKK